MYGVVNLRREAILSVVVGNANRQQQLVDTVSDIGFTWFLSLPASLLSIYLGVRPIS